jgi:FG-GAP repeat/Putative Ig domain
VTATRVEAPVPVPGAQFGMVAHAAGSVFVAAPRDPRTVPVGHPEATGRVYRFEKGAAGWVLAGELVPNTPLELRQFGMVLRGDQDLLVAVSQEQASGGGIRIGAAYVFERNVGGSDAWGLLQRIENPSPHYATHFGHSVATDGEWLVIGSRQATPPPSARFGAAYVYKRNAAGTFTYVQTLAALEAERGEFGWSVSVADDHIAITEPQATPHGHIHLYALDRATGRFDHKQRLEPSAVPCPGGTGECFFSYSVSHYKTTLFAVSSGNDNLYQFDRFGGIWELASRTRPVAAPDFAFGTNLAQSPSLLLASGAGAFGNVGAAYLFYRERVADGISWRKVATLRPEHGITGTHFGLNVAVGSNVAVVGAPQDSARGASAGAAYIYDLHFESAPRFSSLPPSPPGAVFGGAFSHDIVVVDPDGDAITLTAPVKPAWLTLRPGPNGTGTLTGTAPTTSGSYLVTLRAVDSTGRQAEQTFTLYVVDPADLPECAQSRNSRGSSPVLGLGLFLALAALRVRRARSRQA